MAACTGRWFTPTLISAAFFDGIGFWNDKEGIIYGDPLKNRLLLLRTNDGGKSWEAFPEQDRPLLAAGEASFAASGTTIRCIGTQKVIIIATGGKSIPPAHLGKQRCELEGTVHALFYRETKVPAYFPWRI